MIYVPIRTGQGLNAREHWRKRAHRVRQERESTLFYLRHYNITPELPCSVRLTRVGPSNGLDDDNLAGALKAVRDEVAYWLAVDDKRRDVVRYVYAQRRGKQWGVEIEFGEPTQDAQFEIRRKAGEPGLREDS